MQLDQESAGVVAEFSDDADLEVFGHIRQLVQTKLVENDLEYSKITQALQEKKKRVIIQVSLLNQILPEFAKRLLHDPFTYLPPTQAALCDVARNMISLSTVDESQDFVSVKEREQTYAIDVGITGWLGSHGVTPRGLSSALANHMICAEGIITRCSLIHPKLTHATYYIPELQRHFFREHQDPLSVNPKGGRSWNPVYQLTKDSDGHRVEMELGLSFYKDSQHMTLQEMPEATPTGQLPRSVDVICENDLVDSAKPGDRVRVYGVYKAYANKEGSILSGYSRSVIVANNIELLGKDRVLPAVSPSILSMFKEIANRDDTLELVAQSIAPSISGHQKVKMGLALQLIGGQRKQVEGDGGFLRGDIHILLVGDPSCGKSQMLRFMFSIAPLAISTTGRGSSAVGLTAAVVKDSELGSRRLEAGAMVLADGGLVCIDEFDKMGPDDRVAVHEVMEQQRVSINKAGISATLNARCSVLAAANPIYGLFDDSVDFTKQVTFPDSLLSRFDLIYLIRESASAEQDRRIASQVLGQLRVPSGNSLSAVLSEGRRESVLGALQFYTARELSDKVPKTDRNRMMWTQMPASLSETNKRAGARKILNVDFLSQYIQHCKHLGDVALSDEAVEEIAAFYAQIRERLTKTVMSKGGHQTHAKAIPTPRLLEACVRLATAHAKLKLKTAVDVSDVIEAKKLLLYTLCGEDDIDDPNEENVSSAVNTPQSMSKLRRRSTKVMSSSRGNRRRRREEDGDDNDEEVSVEIALSNLDIEGSSRSKRRRQDQLAGAEAESHAEDLWEVIKSFEEKYAEQDWDFEMLLKRYNKWAEKNSGKKVLAEQDLVAALTELQKTNRVMLVGKRAYMI